LSAVFVGRRSTSTTEGRRFGAGWPVTHNTLACSPSVKTSKTAPVRIPVFLIALWEFSLGIYLVVKGFKPSPITAGQGF